MLGSERITIPQWEKHGVEGKERKEGEPIWEDIAQGQIDAMGAGHVENQLGQQDSIQLIERFEGRDDAVWIGVYDGHYLPAEFLEDEIVPNKMAVAHLVEAFREAIKEGKNYENAFKLAFAKVDEKILSQGWGGTTATVMLVEGSDALVANVGDSHAYKFKKVLKPERLTADHNIISNKLAKKEAVERGAVYARGYIHVPGGTGLKLSRSLGDRGMAEAVSHEPEVKKFKITEDDQWLVVASDGLWEEVGPQVVQYALQKSANAEEAKKKILEAVQNVEGGNYDDVSVVVVELKK